MDAEHQATDLAGRGSNPSRRAASLQGCSSTSMGDRLASGSGRQPRPRGQRRQSRAGQPGVGGREATTDRATAEAMTRSEEGCGTTAAALGRQQPGARGGLCIRTPLGRRHCAVKIEPLGDRAAADGSRNFTFMGSDYPLTRSQESRLVARMYRRAWCESRRRGSSLVRYLLCLIGVSRRGGGVQSRWPNRWRRTTRAKRLVRGIAVFVLCASLLVACGSGGGGGGYGGGGGPTTTATTGTSTTSTTSMTTTTT